MFIKILGSAFEGVLVLLGCALLWRRVLSRRARAERPPALLGRWETSASQFVLFLFLVVCAGIASQFAVSGFLRHSQLDFDGKMLVAAVFFQMGMLAGIGVFHVLFDQQGRATPAAGAPGALASGGATFLMALPLVVAVAVAWQELLTLFRLPVQEQDLIDFMLNTHSTGMRILIAICAVIVAPVTEELVFRRGFFRFMRGRTPRWVALWVPAILFGALHVSWGSLDGLGSLAPLVALGIVFSLAYERTGRIGTAMIAHALFNLNVVLLVLIGVDM